MAIKLVENLNCCSKVHPPIALKNVNLFHHVHITATILLQQFLI